jgi:hypothetical protein
MEILVKNIFLLSWLIIISKVKVESIGISNTMKNDAKNCTSNKGFIKNYSFNNKGLKSCNKSEDLLTSDQNFNYVKKSFDSFRDYWHKNENRGNSYRKEINYYRNRDFGKNFHWNSGTNYKIFLKLMRNNMT